MYFNSVSPKGAYNSMLSTGAESLSSKKAHATEQSTDLVEKTNLMFQIENKAINKISTEALNDIKQILERSQVLPDVAQSAYLKHGQAQEVMLGITINGELKAYQNQQGYITSKDEAGELIKQANGDVKQLQRLVQQKYGDGAMVEVFQGSNRPTNAEIFERYTGRSFQSFVAEEITSRQHASDQAKLEQDQYLRNKIMFDQAPQVAVFKVEGQIVGGIDENGLADMGRKLLDIAQQKGIDNAELEPLFMIDPKRSPSQVAKLFTQAFGADAEVEYFTPSNAPTRAQIRQQSEL